MKSSQITRRELLMQATTGLVGWAFLHSPLLAHTFPGRAGEVLVPFLDQPPKPTSSRANLLDWSHLDSWMTPNDKFFRVSHYNTPEVSATDWKLEVIGKVEQPLTLTLNDIKGRQKQNVIYTLECSGNHGFPTFTGAIGTAKWSGTPLAPILEEAGILKDGIEVVFFGSDEGEEEVRKIQMRQNFARSLSITEAMRPDNLLCYEMNDAPLPKGNGFPVRLIVPGWYGIANVKWLKRIEVRDTRYMGRFMARDYVTIREEKRGGKSVWMETSVGRTQIKSLAAKVTYVGEKYRIYGAAWGRPIKSVEVRIDNGPWLEATFTLKQEAEHAWKIWHYDWNNPSAGEHTVVSRAIDAEGNVQPTMDDPAIADKHTYWESNGQVVRRIQIN